MKSYNIIPSTPERSTPKRRSSLRSRNSYGEVLRVIETPNNNGEGVLDSKSVVEESPYGNLEAVCEERAQRILGDASEKDKRRKTSSVPQFLFRSKRLSNLPSENTFLQYVPGTQELSSTPIQSPKTDQKVRQWLMEGNEAPSPTTILSPSRRNVSSTSSKKSLPKNRIKKSLAQDKNEDKEEVCPSPKSSTSSLFFETLSTTPLHCPSLPKSHILKDIVAFVDVFDDLSSCVIDELKLLGASISSLLNKKVSHLIFKDGSLARYNKAKKLDIKIVSISWIEACKTEGKRVDEKDFPTISKEKYDSPTMALFIKRKNNRQRMMTLSTEEKYQRHVAKIRRRRKKEEKMTSKSPTKVEHGTPRPLSRSKNAQSTKQKGLLDQIIESNEDILIFPKTPPSSHKKSSQGSPSCTSILGDDFDTPLSVRVAKQFYANKRRSMLLNSDLGSSPLLGGSKEEEGQQDTQEYEISSDADPNRKRKTLQKKKNNIDYTLKNPTRTNTKRHALYSQGHNLFSETPSPSKQIDNACKPSLSKDAEILKSITFKSPMKIIESESSQPLSQLTLNEKSARYGKKDNWRPSRRSSMDFVRHMTAVTRREEISQRGLREVVCSSGTSDDIFIIKEIIPQFGFYLSKLVSSKTTHVICCSEGPTRRTLNILRGLLRGCWIVSKDWILTSLEKGYLVDEEPYERVDFSPAVESCRVERIAFGSYRSELLAPLGTLHVSRKSSFSSRDVGDLIRLSGGRISPNIEKADILIGECHHENSTAICLKESWLMDSIQYNVIMPFDDYTLNS